MARRIDQAGDGSSGSGTGFRPDIEGLRAVAVALVVLFHASLGFPGGFVGVDVFFVISGFLITGMLLREVEATGTISLRSFYARRARRLLPAAALVLVVTLVASVILLPPLLVPGVSGDAASAALYVSNLRFAAQATDYFSIGQAPSPLLHFWSLSVEEQFYLFWPAIVLLAAGGVASLRGRRIGLAILAISVASFAGAIWLTSADEPVAFFSLPTRAWELGLGAILAVLMVRLRTIPRPAAAVAGWLGLGLIVLAAVILDESTPFPGLAAVLPTVGAGLVIVSGVRPAAAGPTRILGSGGPRFLGRISYSLYLWHWPLLVLPVVVLGSALPTWQRIGLVLAALILAAATERWVETPIRQGFLFRDKPGRTLARAGVLTMSVAIAAVAVGVSASASLGGGAPPVSAAANTQTLDSILNGLATQSPASSPATRSRAVGRAASGSSKTTSQAAARVPNQTRRLAGGPLGSADGSMGGVPMDAPIGRPPTPATGTTGDAAPPSVSPTVPSARPPTVDGAVPANLQPDLADARQDYPEPYLDHCHTEEDGHPNTGTCLYGNLNSSTTIALFGDSHALAWFPAVLGLAEHQGWRVLDLTMSTCTPADVPVYNSTLKRISTECAAWRANSIARLVRERPAIILVTGTRGISPVDPSGNLLTGDAITQAWTAGMQKTLARLIPAAGRVIMIADTPASRVDPPVCLSQHPNTMLACATPLATAINQAWLTNERTEASQAGVGFIDPTSWLCPTSPCPVVLGNLLIYRDPGHMTATFAAALADRLDEAVLQQLKRPIAAAP